MTCRLVHASDSLPEWQAVKLTFFAPCDSKYKLINFTANQRHGVFMVQFSITSLTE